MKRRTASIAVAFLTGASCLLGQPVITQQPTNQVALAGAPASLAVTVWGADPLTYEWRLNGTNLPGGTIKTVAGNGTALNAKLNLPSAVAVDRWGNLFIVDSLNNRIRKVDTNCMITTVAGGGTSGLGDGGAATNASLNGPSGAAVDIAGNLFVVDTGNNRIRKVDNSGIISTFVGNGVPSYSGDGGAADIAGLNAPMRVTLDSIGNLFISDFANGVIRKVDTNGIITTVAGPGTSGELGDGGPATGAYLPGPYGICVDSPGNLFIADYLASRVRRVDTNGIITTVAGIGTNGYSGDGGSATNAQLNYPFDVAVDASSRLWIGDGVNARVRRIDAGGVISTIAGGPAQKLGDGGAATNARLSTVLGIALDRSGNLLIADSYYHRVRKVDTSGIINTVAGTGIAGFFGDDGAGVNGVLSNPSGIVLDKRGNLFIADEQNNRIRMVFPNGQIVTVAGKLSGGYSGDGGPATNAILNLPSAVAVDASGNLLIADTSNGRVRKVDADGNITTIVGGGTDSGDGGWATNALLGPPQGLAFDIAGNLYIAGGRVRKVDTYGIITTVAGGGSANPGDGGSATNAQISAYGVCVDSFGNLFIADYWGCRIRKVDTSGILTTIAGNGGAGYSGDGGAATNAGLYYPTGVIVDSCGNVLIADEVNGRVRKVDTSGIITTVAGGGAAYLADGVPATNATLSCPWSLALDGTGNLLVADQGHNRIRQVQLYASYPALSFLPLALTDAGDYSVLITNFSGSVTSDVMRLTVAVRPDIQSFSRGNGSLYLAWASVSNLNYQVQYSSDLTSANWLNLGATVTATNASSSISDLMGPDRQRFYRVLWVH